jgi:peptidyl-prolyl cis-trans isomerase B (cyclophilin B)
MLPAVRPLRLLPTLAVAGAVALAGCGGSGEKPESTASKPETAAQTGTGGATSNGQAECQKVRAPEPKDVGKVPKPTLKLDPSKTYTATVATSCGTFAIALDVKQAPKTTASFTWLARRKVYDDETFHRVVQGFVIQGGDPQGTGQGGPGYSVVETPPKDLKYTRGVVAMAKTEIEDPGTSGSQFFVVTGPDAQLPPDYALLGRVTSGMDVVQTIGAVPTGPDDQPLDPVVIKSITVKES